MQLEREEIGKQKWGGMSYFALSERFKKKDNPDHLQPNLFLTIQNLDPDVTMVLSRTQSSLDFSLHLMHCTGVSVPMF